MRTLTFSKFDSIYSKESKPETKAWPAWIQLFSKHKVRECDDSDSKDLEDKKIQDECWVFGHIPEGKRKRNVEVVEANAIALDIDKAPDDKIETALEQLARFEYILYSSFSHGARFFENTTYTTRIRVILPLLKSVNEKRFETCWQALNLLTGKITDKQTKNIGRAYFPPATFDPKKAIFIHNKGEWISHRILQEIPGAKKQRSGFYDLNKLKTILQLIPKNEVTEEGLSVKSIGDKIQTGKPFAEKGHRHQAILALTMYLARKTGINNPSTELIAKLFKPSIEIMQSEDPTSPGLEDVQYAYDGATNKLLELKNTTEARAKEKQLRGQQGYDEEDLTQIATKQGWIVEDLYRRWIIQKGVSFYFLDSDGTYKGPFTKDEARPAASSVLSRAPILLNEPTAKTFRRRGILELVEEYGQVAREVIVDLTATHSSFDEKELIFFEAARPIRKEIKPVFNEKFDQCLKLLAEDKYEKLCDWIACVPDLKKLLCALYIGGHPGSLKSGLAFGLAKLWHKGPPSEIERLLGDFTEDLVFCPLVLADEGLPKNWRGANITTKLRSMISTYQRTLSRKYLPPATLVGALRLILSANNEFLLRSTEVLGAADLEAVAQRFLYISAPEKATKYIESLPKKTRDDWFEKDGIAGHALWLANNREVKPGKRFWVEGDVSHMHRMLMSGSAYNAMVCQWLVYYLMKPNQIDVKKDGLVRISDGKLLVNDQALYDGWTIYFPDTRVEPSMYKIGAALKAISTNERPQLRYDGCRIRYRVIDLNNLFAWSEDTNIGDLETMEETLGLRKKITLALVTDDLESVRVSKFSKKIEKMKKAKESKKKDLDKVKKG